MCVFESVCVRVRSFVCACVRASRNQLFTWWPNLWSQSSRFWNYLYRKLPLVWREVNSFTVSCDPYFLFKRRSHPSEENCVFCRVLSFGIYRSIMWTTTTRKVGLRYQTTPTLASQLYLFPLIWRSKYGIIVEKWIRPIHFKWETCTVKFFTSTTSSIKVVCRLHMFGRQLWKKFRNRCAFKHFTIMLNFNSCISEKKETF